MKGMVMVSGCAGFIGSHLTERLLQLGYEVIGIDNLEIGVYKAPRTYKNIEAIISHPRFDFIQMDVNNLNEKLVNIPFKVDVVIHLAAKAGVRPSINNPLDYITTNISGTAAVLEWMKSRGIKKFIYASSSSVYGNNKHYPFKEKLCTKEPISPYALTKCAGELLNYTYHHLYGIGVLNLRFFTVYGPRQRPDLAIHKFVNQIYNNEPITIYGDGSSSRDYTHVDDIVTGIVQAVSYIQCTEGIFETINLGGSRTISITSLVKLLYEITGFQPNVQYLPSVEGDVDITCADIEKASQILQWCPTKDLRTGLVEFVEWYKDTNKV